ncbi:d42d6844-add0-49bf-a980-3505cee3d2a5 [Thermothielavioides terrestris]|uniref:D42d6844-add0-49bf-a980-3505cee3d2a5 n=1 Tax=Thermothielavioides terrestris TaxID=2587410 RepID=A0A446BL30_9PEZI|nr:d42d6844-add0-49bf-a980-3505cee3d2a5 [Thermothielavioides terrestris]
MAEVINQFTQQQNAALEEQKAKYHKYIKRLKRELAEESDVIAQQTSQISTQTHEIKDLQALREEMAGQLRDLEAKLGASEDRARKLEEKYRPCKTHLNSAIQEQQDLYTRSKKHWEQSIEEMRAMEKSQNTDTEMTVRKAEAIRAQMMEKVRQAIAQNKTEALELYKRMDALTQQLEEKEAELSRERESTRVLSEKVQRLQATSTGFEALAAQGKEILDQLGEQAKKTDEQRQKFADELRDRLDAVANRLEALSGMASSQSDALASLRQTQDESLNSVTIKLDNVLECREAAKNATTQLSTDLEINLAKVWQRLDNQLESLSKQLAEKSEENGMMSTLYRRKEAECEKHMKELAALRDTTEKQEQQIQDLDSSLFALDAAHEESEDKIRRLQESAAETAQLREELKSKAAVVAELQSKLDAQDRAHASELHMYTSDIRKLVQALQEKDLSSGIAAQQAAEAARCEIRLEMEKANSKTERLLHETEKQRNALASQVEELKQELREKEQGDSRNSATIHSLQERLSTAEAKQNTMTDEFTQR